jgi:pimeloyl-ACP methyl ester carboxylesterase
MARQIGESNRVTRIAQDGGTHVDGKKAATETGTFLGEFPYVRFGSGPENLVILPGITLDNEPPNRFAAWTYRLGFGRFARDYTVYVINRRRGMPPECTTRDMAQDYARVIEGELGPSHLIGFSTGGSIAQYVALDHPGALRSLILVVSACRLSEAGREICERWQTLAVLAQEEHGEEFSPDVEERLRAERPAGFTVARHTMTVDNRRCGGRFARNAE